MKKLIIISICAALLAACGNADDSSTATNGVPDGLESASVANDAGGPDGAVLPDQAFALDYGGYIIYMDQNMAEVKDALGEPLGEFEALSCAFDGVDRIFRYPGIQIHTYPDGEADFVHTISLRDDSIPIYGGIYIGQNWDDVMAVYGADYEQDFDMYTYKHSPATLSFLVEEGIVTSISFGLIMG